MFEQKPFTIDKKHLILCEGADAESFFKAFFAHCRKYGKQQIGESFQVFDFGGISELRMKLLAISGMDNFDNLKSLLIVRDAETNFHSAIASVCGAVKNVNERNGKNLPIPSVPCAWERGDTSVGFLLFPTCDGNPENGTLEDLCLRLLSEEKSDVIMEDIDTFLDELTEQRGRQFPHRHKTKLHTYFSVTDEFVTKKIGDAARAGAFNWEHEKMTAISNFLSEVL